MRTQTRLEKISTAISLFGMAVGFSVLGFLIVGNQHDGGASITGGILGILLAGSPMPSPIAIIPPVLVPGVFRVEGLDKDAQVLRVPDTEDVAVPGRLLAGPEYFSFQETGML